MYYRYSQAKTNVSVLLCMNRSIVALYLLLCPAFHSYGQSNNDNDTLIMSPSVYVDYCLCNDSNLSFAKANDIPVHHPILIINNIIIKEVKTINVIRKCFHNKYSLLGPYHIVRVRKYTSIQASRIGIKDAPEDGAIAITLKNREILDISFLENWLYEQYDSKLIQ